MNYSKIDAALATVLREAPATDERGFVVFVHTERPPGPKEEEVLENIGVRTGTGGRRAS